VTAFDTGMAYAVYGEMLRIQDMTKPEKFNLRYLNCVLTFSAMSLKTHTS